MHDSESEDVENVFDETSKFMEQDAFSDPKRGSTTRILSYIDDIFFAKSIYY